MGEARWLESHGAGSALKKAVTDGPFFGRFFISSPDFEFANFTITELVDVVLDLARGDRDQVPSKDEVMQLVVGAKSGKHFFVHLKENALPNIGKSEAWGMALMSYALQHLVPPQDHKEAGGTRPIIEVARFRARAMPGIVSRWRGTVSIRGQANCGKNRLRSQRCLLRIALPCALRRSKAARGSRLPVSQSRDRAARPFASDITDS